MQTVGYRKKKFSVISFQKFLIFPMCVFQKTVNVLSEHSFKLYWLCPHFDFAYDNLLKTHDSIQQKKFNKF